MSTEVANTVEHRAEDANDILLFGNHELAEDDDISPTATLALMSLIS